MIRVLLAFVFWAMTLVSIAEAHVPGADRYLKDAFAVFPPQCENPTFGQEPLKAPTIAYARSSECRIAFMSQGHAAFPHPHYWPAWVTCTVAYHEAGHLHGLGHSDDPTDVMYPLIERHYWRCADATKRPTARMSREGRL